MRSIVPSLPFYLEFGSIIFFASAFPHVKQTERKIEGVVTVSLEPSETATKLYTRDDALEDFRKLDHVGAQHLLADRWGVARGHCIEMAAIVRN